MTDLLLLAAFGPELAPLKPAFARAAASSALGAPPPREDAVRTEAMSAPMRGLLVRARTCGVGLPAAAAYSSFHVREAQPRAVVLLGTCGAYRGVAPAERADERADPAHRAPSEGAELAIGDVVVSRRIVLADWGALEGHAQFPPATAEPISADTRLSDSLARAGARPGDVANTLGITVKDDVAGRLAKSTGAAVEHLEAYGVATACAAADVPFAAVLGVANFVGSSGREEWRCHHVRASEAAAQLVLAWIESMAADGLSPCLGPRAP